MPQFRGGGKGLRPGACAATRIDLPKKVRALALRHALSAKAKDGELVVLEKADRPRPRPRRCGAASPSSASSNALIIDGAELDENFALAARNIPQDRRAAGPGLNVYDILRRETLVLTKAARRSAGGAVQMSKPDRDAHYDVDPRAGDHREGDLRSEHNQVVFQVAHDATKPQIKAAVERLFKVKVKAVNTLVRKGKTKRFRGRPRRAVRRQEGDRDARRGPDASTSRPGSERAGTGPWH